MARMSSSSRWILDHPLCVQVPYLSIQQRRSSKSGLPLLMCPTLRIATLTICLALGLGKAAAADIDEALRQRFLEGVASTREKIEKISVRARYQITRYDFPENNVKLQELIKSKKIDAKRIERERTEKYQCAVHGLFVKEVNLSRKSGTVEVYAKNTEYVFAVTKKPILERYSLTFVGELGNLSPKIEDLAQYNEAAVYEMVFGCWHCYGLFLWEWPEQEGFAWKSVTSSQVDGSEIVRVEFDYFPPSSAPRFLSRAMVDAYFECDPGNAWQLVTAGFSHRKHPVKVRSVFTTQTVDGYEYPLPSAIIQDTISSDNKIIRRIAYNIDILDGSDITEEEFYLSHYGLPEPNFESSFPTWLTYALVGLACLAVVYFWRRKQLRTG